MSVRSSDEFRLPADYYDPPEYDRPYGYDDPDELRDAQLEREWAAEALLDDVGPFESDMPVSVMKRGYEAMQAWQKENEG